MPDKKIKVLLGRQLSALLAMLMYTGLLIILLIYSPADAFLKHINNNIIETLVLLIPMAGIPLIYFRVLSTDRIKFYGEKTFEDIRKLVGGFSYTARGFEYHEKKQTSILYKLFRKNKEPLSFEVEWNDIDTIYCSKRDGYMVDRVSMNIVTIDKRAFYINEDTEGWHVFIEKLETYLPFPDLYIRLLGVFSKDKDNTQIIFERGK
jgi:hypothetical protein